MQPSPVYHSGRPRWFTVHDGRDAARRAGSSATAKICIRTFMYGVSPNEMSNTGGVGKNWPISTNIYLAISQKRGKMGTVTMKS